MSGVQIKTVKHDEEGMRLDRWFRVHFPQIRHGMLEKFLRKGQVRLDGGRVKANVRLLPGQNIRVPPLGDIKDDNRTSTVAPGNRQNQARDREALERIVIHEDDQLLILNKPHGLAVQGGTNTLRHIDGMLAAWPSDGDRPRLVHRLDRDTSGVLVLAKTRKAATRLGEAFQKHQVEKTYWALTAGTPQPREGTITIPVAKRMVSHEGEGFEKMVPAEGEDAKRAITDFQTLDDAGAGVGFLALRPRTGRTHQIRVHCAALGIPIIGDGKYSPEDAKVDGLSSRLHLFCRTMQFRHPDTGKPFSVTAPVGGHMLASLNFFTFDVGANVEWPDVETLRN